MKISRENLLAESAIAGFRPELLEKAMQLLNLLEGLCSHPFLGRRLVLKGGTAINFFLYDLPRLSLDIDLNYVGSLERDRMVEERPKVEDAVRAVCSREGFAITRLPTDHAGGKWRLRYESSILGEGSLEVDLSYMFRLPLWEVQHLDANAIGSLATRQIPILSVQELTAGKLAALFSRFASRDLFDVHLLLTRGRCDARALRLGFVVYGAMNRRDWRQVSLADLALDPGQVRNELAPFVRRDDRGSDDDRMDWVTSLIEDCRRRLDIVLPFCDAEREFLDRLLDYGEIEPSLLTNDQQMAQRISAQPLLRWKALNVRQHKGLT